MKLTFTKRIGKFDQLLIERGDGSTETIQSPKQGIIPHDMVHFAVEKIIFGKGFLSKIAAGEAARPRMAFESNAEAVERLVEAMQAELWSGTAPSAEIVELYQQSCHARSHPFFPVSEEDIQLIRNETDALTAEWEAVPVQGSLVLSFETAV